MNQVQALLEIHGWKADKTGAENLETPTGLADPWLGFQAQG